ncbi:MAG: PQQ-binding-like beta-propeller repeat protein, partial [Planctomycetota bacterium]
DFLLCQTIAACTGISVVGSAALGLTPPSAAAPPTSARLPDQAGLPGSVIRDSRAWAGFANGAQNVSVAPVGTTGPGSIVTPRFVFDGDGGRTFVFYGQAALAVADDLIIGVGFETFAAGAAPRASTDHGGSDRVPIDDARPTGADSVIAISRLDGSFVWEAPIPVALLNSWAAPAIDPHTRTVVAGSGSTLSGIHLDTGDPLWSTDLGRIVVNASPTITDDRPGRTRAFVTDYSFASSVGGRLFCVNLSPHDGANNPYEPGEIVWSAELGGETSGNTPGYHDGRVYVSTASGGNASDQGTILAYDADATLTPAPLWRYELDSHSGFFSGVAVYGDGLYAASYSFSGDQFSGRTVRVDRHTGDQVWSVGTNRTDTVPVPFGPGLVLVSGGVPFNSQFPAFGSVPSIQLIMEFPWGGATRLWDSAIDTLHDTNSNGQWDPGESFLSLGGWTIQPAVIVDGQKAYAYVGVSPDPLGSVDGFFDPSPAMALVDLSKLPDEHGFVAEWHDGSGSSPALSGGELYTVGFDGVFSFGAPAMPVSQILIRWSSGSLPDLNADGMVNFRDLMAAMEHAIR